MPDVLPDNWPLWLVVLMIFVKVFRDDLAKFIPVAIQDHFRHYAKMRADRQEHSQEMEGMRIEAWRSVNEHLVRFITGQIDSRLAEVEKSIASLRALQTEDNARDRTLQTELSRAVESLHRQEIILEKVKSLLASLVSTHPAMQEDE